MPQRTDVQRSGLYWFMHIDKITAKSDYNGSVKFNYLQEYVPPVYLHAFIQIRAMDNIRSACNAILVVQFKSMSFAISIIYSTRSNTLLTPLL
jgi:hypothetical protein